MSEKHDLTVGDVVDLVMKVTKVLDRFDDADHIQNAYALRNRLVAYLQNIDDLDDAKVHDSEIAKMCMELREARVALLHFTRAPVGVGRAGAGKGSR